MERVALVKAMEEIESLRHQLAMLSQISVVREREKYKRKYQIVCDSMSDKEFAELCELWPELKNH